MKIKHKAATHHLWYGSTQKLRQRVHTGIGVLHHTVCVWCLDWYLKKIHSERKYELSRFIYGFFELVPGNNGIMSASQSENRTLRSSLEVILYELWFRWMVPKHRMYRIMVFQPETRWTWFSFMITIGQWMLWKLTKLIFRFNLFISKCIQTHSRNLS